jgi:hypothetical protein
MSAPLTTRDPSRDSSNGFSLRGALEAPREAKALLKGLAAKVEELYLLAQAALPLNQAVASAVYRDAYAAYRNHKLLMAEQDAELGQAAA